MAQERHPSGWVTGCVGGWSAPCELSGPRLRRAAQSRAAQPRTSYLNVCKTSYESTWESRKGCRGPLMLQMLREQFTSAPGRSVGWRRGSQWSKRQYVRCDASAPQLWVLRATAGARTTTHYSKPVFFSKQCVLGTRPTGARLLFKRTCNCFRYRPRPPLNRYPDHWYLRFRCQEPHARSHCGPSPHSAMCQQ